MSDSFNQPASTEATAVVQEESPTAASSNLAALHTVIEEHFPTLWPAVEAGLSVCGTLLLADNVNPTALIYVGPPSSGKTTVASMFDGANVKEERFVYRSDKFSTSAFVSHSATVSKKELTQIDLLPRLRHKVLLTPDLSTIFRGKADELTDRMSIITRVLDGQGFSSDSGTHGQRGYSGDYLFAWIGCTTPFGDNAWRVMAQLGSRLFFLSMDAIASPSVDDLVRTVMRSVSHSAAVETCKTAVHTFLDTLFQMHQGVRGVQWNSQADPPEVIMTIAKLATLLSLMRVQRKPGVRPQPESPHRANAVLYNLARGHALINGRTNLTVDDLLMVARIALSSMPAERRAVLTAFARYEGQDLRVGCVADAANVSRHTAESIMQDAEALSIAEFHRDRQGRPSRLILRPEWAWSVQGDFGRLILQAATWQKAGDALEDATSHI